jgi:hypothetical protein
MQNMREDGEDRFIAGIFNYCDRWCEQCRFTDRCRVFAQEQRQMERHLLRGEDPDDPAVFMGDLQASLGESVQMLQEMADEMGVNLDDLPEAEEPGPREPHPLEGRTWRWSERVGVLLKRVRADLPIVNEELTRRAESFLEREREEAVSALEGLRDACELLGRYHTMIYVKTVRATQSLAEAESESNPELASHSRGDALGTAKLVHECLGKAGAALWCVAEFRQDWQDEALPLAAETESLRQQMDSAFPGHQAFCRPGLDEIPRRPE